LNAFADDSALSWTRANHSGQESMTLNPKFHSAIVAKNQ
jgi:hypothetical protein